MSFSGKLLREALVATDLSEELSTSVIRGAKLVQNVGSIWRTEPEKWKIGGWLLRKRERWKYGRRDGEREHSCKNCVDLLQGETVGRGTFHLEES
jgi:hypothetical protein